MAATKKSQRGANNPAWKGGRHVDSRGYVTVVVDDDDEIGMAMVRAKPSHTKYGWCHIHEHRLVMAHHLGRPLDRGEVVHHINGNRTDNRIENLSLVASRAEHARALHYASCPHCGKPLRGEMAA